MSESGKRLLRGIEAFAEAVLIDPGGRVLSIALSERAFDTLYEHVEIRLATNPAARPIGYAWPPEPRPDGGRWLMIATHAGPVRVTRGER